MGSGCQRPFIPMISQPDDARDGAMVICLFDSEGPLQLVDMHQVRASRGEYDVATKLLV